MTVEPTECFDLLSRPISSDDNPCSYLPDVFLVANPDTEDICIQFFQIAHHLSKSRTEFLTGHP